MADKKTDEELAADDRHYFGTSFMRRREDGSMERIDPKDIFIETAKPKWPGRVTSSKSKTECAHASCPDTAACRKGCIHQQPITMENSLEIH